MLKVGLTGGIGSGKSTAGRLFMELGVPLIDADAVAREVVQPGQPALADIAERFGADALLPDGALNRPRLRTLVFSNPEARHDLERITHPRIRQRICTWLNEQEGPYCILESPLLLETDQRQLVDRVIVVDVPVALQVKRTVERDGVDEAQVRAIIEAQISRTLRLQAADDIISNETTIADLRRQVSQIHQRLSG